MNNRQLVTFREVGELIPIDGADRIELARIDGWQCIVKKGEFKVGDSGIFFEIDSVVPSDDERFEFLGRGRVRPSYRIKTMRMKKVLSQGLLMPPTILTSTEKARFALGESLQDILKVQKYEPPMPIAGEQKGTFPTHLIPKTDQERIQNIPSDLQGRTAAEFEVTEKLDGTSCTFFYYREREMVRIGVCSRNWEMELDDDNVYARLFKASGLKFKLYELDRNIAIQGEIIGGRIQGNKYHRAKQEFYVFDIYDIDGKQYFSPSDKMVLMCELGLSHVPIIIPHQPNLPLTLDTVLDFAEGKSMLYDTQREGLVFKEMNGSLTFKAISNKFLLKNDA